MDPGNSKASDFERRLSRRSSARVSALVGDGEGEDVDFDFSSAAISDGFRPPNQSSIPPPPAEPETPTPPISQSVVANPTENTTPPPQPNRPSSIAKHPRPGDSFSLRHDGTMGPINEASSRSSSTSDSQPYISPESPYHGPSNPSHPYQMYTQNVRVARTASVATSSTTPASDTSFPDPRGPTHPYTMYPQGTISESNTAQPAAIPVGFPGIPDRYQRRIGPEGEDVGDIIGPDGHTEQLPPYTRYPDEAYAAKVGAAVENSSAPTPAATNAAAVSSTPATSQVTVPVGAVLAPATTPAAPATTLDIPQPIPGAGGIGLATRDPEFESADDLDSPHSRHSLRSFASESSNRAINQAAAGAAGLSEKKRLSGPRHWGRRRAWGIIPYWAIALTLVVVVMMSIIVGSVIGSFFAKHKKPPRHGSSFPAASSTMTYDATPIPTPSNLPPLNTGTFGMLLMNNRVSSTCFSNPELSQAWSCNILPFAGLSMTIDKNRDTPERDYTISLTCNDTQTLAGHQYSYGEQPPLILDPAPMMLVNDTLEPARGPAWFKMLNFNKTVILHENQFPPPGSDSDGDGSSSKLRRGFNSFGEGGPGDIKRKGTAHAGDRPWICTWPETLLEIFVYPQQNSSWNRPPPSYTGTATGTATGTGGDGTTTGAPTPTGVRQFNGDGDGGAPFGSHVTGPSEFPTPTDSSFPTPTGTDNPFGPMPPPPYPKVVKMEERRVANSPKAACRQVEIVADGQPARPVKDANGNEVVVFIDENIPDPEEQIKLEHDRERERVRRIANHAKGQRYYHDALDRRDSSADLSACGCMWFIT